MDQRDKTSWVALELSTLGENRVSEGTFQELLVRQLKDPEIEIFIPVVSYVRGESAYSSTSWKGMRLFVPVSPRWPILR